MSSPNDRTFSGFLADYLADVVHDIQNYTITISLGKESLWSLIKNNIPAGEDQKNIQNFLKIIENSNNKINDITYLINAIRIFFEGSVHLHDETVEVEESVKEVIAKLNYKFSPTKYEIDYEHACPGGTSSVVMDRDALKYLLTMLIKIQKAEKQGFPMRLTTVRNEGEFVLELSIKGESLQFEKRAFTNALEAFPAKDLKDEDFLKFVHFFVISAIASRYGGEFLLSSGSGNSFNGFRVTMKR